MKRIGIVLLAVLILTVLPCIGSSIENCGSVSGYVNTSGRLVIESIDPEAHYFALMNSIESKVTQVQSLNSRFFQPTRERYGNSPQNVQPSFRGERPEKLPSELSRKEPMERGIPERRFNDSFLEKETLQQQNKSYYQSYVTPYADSVESYLEENDLDDKYEIYEAALSWTWVSDETLNGVEEKWFTPTEFLEETPTYSTNPDYGNPVSDCEEQANTLVSLLIASGEYNESTARVAVGKVDFGNTSGGHAWVEVCENGEWFPLDPTYGSYYDDESCELVSVDTSDIDYDEYLTSKYPAVEVWYYYNNKYFTEVGNGNGNAPVSWNKAPESYQ